MRLCIYVSIKHLENELAMGNTGVMIDCVPIRLDIHWRYAGQVWRWRCAQVHRE